MQVRAFERYIPLKLIEFFDFGVQYITLYEMIQLIRG